MRKFIVAVVLSVLCSVSMLAQTVGYYHGKKIVDGKIIFKYASNTLKSASVQDVMSDGTPAHSYLEAIGATNIRQKFLTQIFPANCADCVDLRSIYECTYTGTIPFEKVLSTLNSMECIAYAEPSYISELLYVPDDTEYGKGNLWHLNTCKVLDAWDVEQGDSTVVIGILDGGIDIIHSDLINKIAYNIKDPIDGIDNDGDGYVDNYRGWDMADGDNNPTSTLATEHGTYVAGIASAEVNNAFGTAGVGYKTKFLPIKVCKDGSASVTNGYDAIVYAANMGCKVINCSWGDDTGTKFGQDIVNYATKNCDALIVAAAGNSAAKDMYYPASYDNVLSVGGTVAGDFAWSDGPKKGTHYNRFVDICAPAKGFYSIANGDKVIAMAGGGTSFSAPIVSGAAALVRSKYPEYTAIQVGELLRVTADDIYEMNEEKYTDLLGNGRLNLYKALTNTTLPSIRVKSFAMRNSHIYDDDSVIVDVTFKNYLHDAVNLSVTAHFEDFLLDDVASVDCSSFKADEEKTLTFIFRSAAEPLVGIDTYCKFVYTADNGYRSFEYVPVQLNTDFFDFELGQIQSTATRDGSIGVYSVFANQNGFNYNNNGNCIYQAGLVLAENQSTVYSSSYWHRDFDFGTFPTMYDADSCDALIYSDFSVENIDISQYIYGWEDTSALVYEYRIRNNRDTVLNNLRFGNFIDWDILNSSYNKIWYVDSLQLTVVCSVDPRSYYVGYMPLDTNKNGMYAFNVADDVLYYDDGFTSNELWYALTHQQTAAGTSYSGAEIAAFQYEIIDSIAPYDYAVVRFALLAADSKEQLYEQALRFQQKYNLRPEQPIDTTNPVGIEENSLDEIRLCKENDMYYLQIPSNHSSLVVTAVSFDGKIVGRYTISPETCVFPIKNMSAVSLLSVSNGKTTKQFILQN